IVIYATGLGDLAAGTLVTVTDSSTPPQSTTATLPVMINSAAAPTQTLSITGTVADSMVNATYPPTTLQASAGTPPYKWTGTGIPNGLALSGSWVLSGKPTAAGVYTMKVTVTDSSSPALTATTTYTITISMSMTPVVLPVGVAGVVY